MSESSLWLIDKNFYGYEEYEFKNSWLFSPVLWNVLSDKYLPRMNGCIQSLTGLFGRDVFEKINLIMNESENDYERFCWEFSHQQIFNTKDKTLVSNAIRQFLELNNKYYVSEEDKNKAEEVEGTEEVKEEKKAKRAAKKEEIKEEVKEAVEEVEEKKEEVKKEVEAKKEEIKEEVKEAKKEVSY